MVVIYSTSVMQGKGINHFAWNVWIFLQFVMILSLGQSKGDISVAWDVALWG